MKSETSVNFVAKIKNFERVDQTDRKYVDFTLNTKREIENSFHAKKFRISFGSTHLGSHGDGNSVHATSTHRNKAILEANEEHKENTSCGSIRAFYPVRTIYAINLISVIKLLLVAC